MIDSTIDRAVWLASGAGWRGGRFGPWGVIGIPLLWQHFPKKWNGRLRGAMRCYLMLDGHIRAVHILTRGPDVAMIAEAEEEFKTRATEGFDGFEVWDLARFVYRYPPDSEL